MTAYRRNLLAGGTYFFTVNLADRRLSLLTDNIELLRAAFRYTRRRHPFTIDAIVVLPDHLHALWTLPPGDSDFATRWRLIKTTFSHGLCPAERVSASRSRKGERGVWQRRFWEHTIRDHEDFVRHMDYIHFNPVKHRYVEHVQDWPFSSFHRMVRLGWYSPEWAGRPEAEPERGFGER
jgi:REP-associated tyrosine transposase